MGKKIANHVVKITLQPEDVVVKAKRLAVLSEQIRQEDSKLDIAKRHHKSETEDRALESERLMQEIHQGFEEREVACEVEYDYHTNEALYYHESRIVHRRGMNQDEYQKEFPGV